MAKVSDTSGASNIWLGSKQNSRQTILYIPAEATADKPGLIFLESISATGSAYLGGVYLWADNTGVLRYSTSIPTTEDSSGTVLGTTTGATTELDNLGTVAINTALLDDVGGNDDIGSATQFFKDFYFGGDLYCQTAGGGSFDVKLAFTTPTADYTYTFPDAAAAADVMLDTGGADAITYTSGTSTITFGDNADLDIATTIQVDIDNTLTVQGNTSITAALTVAGTTSIGAGGFSTGSGAVAFVGTSDYNQATGVSVDINGGLTVGTGGLTTSTTAVTLDQDLQASASPTFVAITCQGISNTTTVIDTTAQLQVGADNVSLTFGDDDDSDSEIYFDGSDLRFFDGGTRWTLGQLASGTTLNPTVTGDLTITDGNFTWDNNTTTETATWTLDSDTVDGILLVSGATTAAALHITADSAAAAGKLLQLDNAGGFGAAGFYIYADDDTDTPFTVGDHGALTMVSTSDVKHKISRDNASTDPVLEIEELATDGDVTLLIDSDHTGASDAMQITYAGTEYGLNITGGNVAGSALYVAGPASQTAPLIFVDGNTGAGWIGVATVGMIQIENDADLADADTHLIQIDNTGTVVATTTGTCLHITDGSTGGGTGASAVYINSSTQDALWIADGTTNIDDYVDIDGYVALTASDALSQHALVITQEDTNASKDGLQISFASDGRGLYVTNTKVDGTNAVFATGVADTTDPNVLIDGSTANWIGASNGMLHLKADTELAAVDGSLLLIDYEAGATTKDDAAGSCLRITDQSSAGSGTVEYAAYIKSDNNQALLVDAGYVQVDEYVSAGGHVLQAHGALATVGGATTGELLLGEGFISATSNDDSHIIALPEAVAGNIIWIMNEDAAQDVEIKAKAGDTINGGAAAGSSTLGEGILARLIAVTAVKWVGTYFAADGTESKMDASA